MSDFYRTRMGQTFYEHTLPSLIRAIERLATAVEAMVEMQRFRDDARREGMDGDGR
jgi:hypothetical protein